MKSDLIEVLLYLLLFKVIVMKQMNCSFFFPFQVIFIQVSSIVEMVEFEKWSGESKEEYLKSKIQNNL
jgi:hypothetical protein